MALFALTYGVVYVIDPYSTNGAIRIQGVNIVKPEAPNHIRLRQAMSVVSADPQTIVLGTSTALTGIDPEYQGLPYRPAINLGLPGANIYEIYRYYQHATSLAPVHLVLEGLDFFSFDANLPNRPDFREDLLAVSAAGKSQQNYRLHYLASFVSVDSIAAVIHTLRDQADPSDVAVLPDGRLLRSETQIHSVGQRQVFATELTSIINQTYCSLSLTGRTTQFQYLEALLNDARKRSIQVVLFTSPVHALNFEALRVAGAWNEYEQWKLDLAQLVEEERAKGTDVTLFDFSQLDSFAQDAVPAPGDKASQMEWYWDPEHYTKERGDELLQIIFSSDQQVQAPFLMSTKMLRAGPDHVRTQLARWEASHATEVQFVRSLRKDGCRNATQQQ